MVFQLHYLFEHLTALDNVWLAPVHVARRAARRTPSGARRRCSTSSASGTARSALPRELSGGEAQRVAIARALAVDPPLLLMDEPTASLDPARRDELGETLQALAAQGRTLVMTSHDDDFVRDFATRVVVLSEGCVVEEGHPRDVLDESAASCDARAASGGKRTRTRRARDFAEHKSDRHQRDDVAAVAPLVRGRLSPLS